MVRQIGVEEIVKHADSLFETLNGLSPSPKITDDKLQAFLQTFSSEGNILFVYLLEERVVATAKLFIEKKLIRGGVFAGHIEEVVTHKDFLGNGYGKKVVEAARKVAFERGCYKVILNCQPHLEKYYTYFGFTRKGLQMELRNTK